MVSMHVTVTCDREISKIIVTCDTNFSKRYLKCLPGKYLMKHYRRDWLRLIASDKDKDIYDLRYFKTAENRED